MSDELFMYDTKCRSKETINRYLFCTINYKQKQDFLCLVAARTFKGYNADINVR